MSDSTRTPEARAFSRGRRAERQLKITTRPTLSRAFLRVVK